MATKTLNLFAAATKVKETGKKKVTHQTHKCVELKAKVARFLKLKNFIDSATAQLEMVAGDIKATGKNLFMNDYASQKSKPDNFNIEDETGKSCMFIVQDKYTQVDEGKAALLAKYNNVLDENILYTMDAGLIEKHGQTLSNLIVNCKSIPDEDKANLIRAEKTFSIKKGTIERLLQYPQPGELFNLINPICALKK